MTHSRQVATQALTATLQFFWIDAHELHHPPKSILQRIYDYFSPPPISSTSYSTQKKKRYSLAKTLRQDFRSLPPHKNPPNETGVKINYDDYVIVNVGPSVVPAYLPSVRVFRYNVTQWGQGKKVMEDIVLDQVEEKDDDEKDDSGSDSGSESDSDSNGEEDEEDTPGGDKKKKGSKRHHGHRYVFCFRCDGES